VVSFHGNGPDGKGRACEGERGVGGRRLEGVIVELSVVDNQEVEFFLNGGVEVPQG
jgi:hypothetical protein